MNINDAINNMLNDDAENKVNEILAKGGTNAILHALNTLDEDLKTKIKNGIKLDSES